MRALRRLAIGLLRVVDNTHIANKVMIAPAIAMVAFVLLFGVTLHMFHAEEASERNVHALSFGWLEPMTGARVSALSLQANFFRLAALGLMGASQEQLRATAERTRLDDAQLQALLRNLPSMAQAPQMRSDLLAAYDLYRGISSNAVINVLKNPGWGATTARNAAAALDMVITAATRLRTIGRLELERNIDHLADLRVRLRHNVFAVIFAGGIGVVLANMLIGWRISSPLRSLTQAMTRLADQQYDQEIPAVEHNDEIGSMARAVLMFKKSLIRKDAIAAELEATETLLDTVLTHLPIPIVVKDAADLQYVLVNPAAQNIGPGTLRKTRGMTSLEAYSPVDAATFAAGDQVALASGGLTVQHDVQMFADTAHPRIADMMRMVVPGTDGKPRYLITAMLDLTERRDTEQRLAYMAQHDGLTDLPNRGLFSKRLEEALLHAGRDATQIAILALDLDRFKDVNDTLGHDAGDEALRLVTTRLNRCLRSGDTLARLGGDEFAVIQRNIKAPVDTEALAARLISSVRDPFEINGQRVFIGLSVGCAVSNQAVSATELAQQADLALFDAKQSGRGTFRFFAPQLSATLRERRSIEQDLRSALTSGQLSLNYQPSISLGTGAIVGTEALMRWNHPTRGAIPPSTFIPLAEETGLIGPLGLWLLDEACREAASWALPIRIAVNVSPVQFRTPGFATHVQEALQRSGLAASRLELEITEGVLMRDTEETLTILADLREIGVRIALDDFGTGYASLAYLQTFIFDKLKIDRSFVQNIETDPTALAIMRAVLGLTESLHMTTTAEGIEEETQADLLRILGCNEAQGYLFWRPMPAVALRALLEEQTIPCLAIA